MQSAEQFDDCSADCNIFDYHINLTVRYEDAFGHEEAFTSAVSITVEELRPITPPSDDPETSETAAITWILIGLCAVFAIAIVVQGILLRGKLHKLEEDKL